jgi:hypothetical protein
MNVATVKASNPAQLQILQNHRTGGVLYKRRVYLFDVKEHIPMSQWFEILPLQNNLRGVQIIQAHLVKALQGWQPLQNSRLRVFPSTFIRVIGREVYITAEGPSPLGMLDRALTGFTLTPAQVKQLLVELQEVRA